MSIVLAYMDKESGEIFREYDPKAVMVVKKKEEGEETGTEKKEGIRMGTAFIKNNHIELREVLKELDLYEKAVLNSMMNYIEYRTNCVVINGEKAPTIETIAEISGIGRTKTVTVLKSLERKHLLSRAHVGEGKRLQYYINPWIATRGEWVNATLKSMFAEYPVRTKGMRKWKDL